MQESQSEQENLQPTSVIEINGSSITLLGTAHVSRASAEAVERHIASGRYDAIAVELCPSRHNAIVNPDALAKMDLFQVFKEGKAAMVAANLALGAHQQRMAEQFDIQPGAEMRIAIEKAQEANLPVLLIDREIGTTLKRVYRNVPWWQRFTIITGLFASIVSREKVSEEDIEKLKEGDILESTFSQFAQEAEFIYKPLVDERDQYMSARLVAELKEKNCRNILAVIGAGHMKGMTDYLNKGIEEPQTLIDKLDRLPPPGKLLKFLPWLIVVIIIIGFALGFSRNTELGIQLIKDWVLINGGFSAIGAIIATGHPLTIITAFIAAPITSLNPMIGAGMVAAAAELYVRKPSVGDFEKLRSDTTRVIGWWKNRVTRTLLVFLLASLGSGIGTYVAGFRIFERLSS
ncbi:MAG: TraB/GumN family protein [Gammaproteobacteria bacterium]|nr:TraB/GumN family protein [Gammaproteobacteria bacterium]